MLIRLVLSVFQLISKHNILAWLNAFRCASFDRAGARRYAVDRYKDLGRNWQAGTLLIFAYTGFIVTSIGLLFYIHCMHDQAFFMCSMLMRLSSEIILNAAKFQFGFQ